MIIDYPISSIIIPTAPMKRTLILLVLVLSGMAASAQDSIPSLSSKPRNPDSFWRRVSVGGNLGFQFGTVTGITIAPEVRVRTVDQLHVGVRFIYQYFYDKNYFYDMKTDEYLAYKANVLGGSIYLRYYLSSLFDNFVGNIFAHVEYEYLVYNRPFSQSPTGTIVGVDGITYVKGKEMIEYNSFFIGGGYRQPLGNRVSMEMLLLYNINDTYNSPYSNPVFRLGVGVGL
jgi:hypothetical protein